ncbi:MAG: prepilin peptidase [Patescibacteria group bacterium]
MYFSAFVFGAIIGSFLNSVLFRKNTGNSPLWGRSRCFSCGKKLSWLELVPILSFIIQKRRCGQCGSRISWQYPVVEILIAILAVLLNFKFSTRLPDGQVFNFQFWFYFTAFCSLFLIAAYDFRHKIIERHFLYIFGGFAVVNTVYRNIQISTYRYLDILAALGIFLFFYLLWRVSDGKWMGRGDADLVFFSAIFLGYPLSLFMLLGSFWIGALFGVVLLITSFGRITIKSEVPFGPFIAIALFIAWYFSDMLTFLYEFIYF